MSGRLLSELFPNIEHRRVPWRRGPMFVPHGGAAAPSLDLGFMTPGALDSRITFTRGSTATYFDATGTLQTATTNTPRWDYDPTTHALRGLLIEEQRTNLMLQSGNVANAAWINSGGPVITANQTTAPDGTVTAARVAFTAVSTAPNSCQVGQSLTATAVPYTLSVWVKGNAGGEQMYLMITPNGALYYSVPITLTTSWQRFTLTTPALTAATWFWQLGVDLRDAAQTAKPAQTAFVWGGQFEAGAFPTSYIPTTGAAVTRAQDKGQMAFGSLFNTAASTLQAESSFLGAPSIAPWAMAASIDDGTSNNRAQIFRKGGTGEVMTSAGGYNPTLAVASAGVVVKAAIAFSNGAQSSALNGTAGFPDTQAGMPVGITTLHLGVAYDNASFPLNGYLRRVQYWPRVLSNAEMQTVTT